MGYAARSSLFICTILYIAVSLVLTGIVPYTNLNVTDPVAFAMEVINQGWAAGIISLGAVVGMMTVILVMMYGGTRLLMAFARDGLMPKIMSDLSPKRKTPVKNTLIFTGVISIFAGFIPLDALAELVNMGTLIAFVFVSAGILYLRKNKDIPEGGFKVPFYPVLPIISLLLCIFLISQLSLNTWIGCGVWFIIGLIVYFAYGKKHSTNFAFSTSKNFCASGFVNCSNASRNCSFSFFSKNALTFLKCDFTLV